jgi:serpin B
MRILISNTVFVCAARGKHAMTMEGKRAINAMATICNLMNSLRILICCSLIALMALSSVSAADFNEAASATNQLSLDLYKKLATGEENLCLSPYSIESALAMTFAGADGETRREMAHALHLQTADDSMHGSFAALQKSLEEMAAKTEKNAADSKKFRAPSDPIALRIANRLFAQKDYDFRAAFLALVKNNYGAPMEPLDFKRDAARATTHINDWVAEQTRKRIRDLIPRGALNATTRMVLANALYLKAPWQMPFEKGSTRPEPFHVRGSAPVSVPTMHQQEKFGYAKRSGFTAVSLPYSGRELNFVILRPDDVKGLAGLEAKLTSNILAECRKLPAADIILSMPKFKLEPPTIALKPQLEALGMKTAFDEPPGSANFDRLAPRRPNDYLYLSKVFHKTFIAVDEEGTEAAAATAVAMSITSAMPQSEPIEVKVDRPFLYLIQHAPSGVCLFIGRVTDPR